VRQQNILLGVSGSISAYKAAHLARLLIKSGHRVQVAMTQGGQRFIQPVTFEAITGQPVLTSLWNTPSGSIEHVEQSHQVDLILIAPASANLLARLAVGMADDVLTATCLSTTSPIIVAPAMETGMWLNSATQENVAKLKARGYQVLDPEPGELASGRSGLGRLPEPEFIADFVINFPSQRDLENRRIVITAGPTHESLDPVRILSNRSTGAMGIAFADRAYSRGASVDLILGPTHLLPAQPVNVHQIESAQEMLEAVEGLVDGADVFIAAAAVSDFRLRQVSQQKLKRNHEGAHQLELIENPDILATVSPRLPNGLVIGFAAETENVEQNAKEKMHRKGCDMVVANQVGREQGFGPGETSIILIQKSQDTLYFGPGTKSAVANFVLDQVAQTLRQ